jgi:hypothetical protein
MSNLFPTAFRYTLTRKRILWVSCQVLLCVLSLTGLNTVAVAQSKKVQTNAQPIITLYSAGDIADCRKTPAEQTMAAQTAKLINTDLARNKNAYVITLGDNTYPIGKPEEFNNCYDKTWGKFKAITLPSPGNHDYGVPMANGYYNYFDDLAGPGRRGYYKKTLGNWLLLSLNSNIKGQAMQEQKRWLKGVLAQRQSTCVMAFWHHPVFSSGGHGNVQAMREVWEMLADARVDLVLSSHDHDYERFAPLDKHGRPDNNGIRSFVVGTGGANLTSMLFVKDGSEIRQNDSHGVLKLQLRSNSYSWEFLSVTKPNQQGFTDQGDSNCH